MAQKLLLKALPVAAALLVGGCVVPEFYDDVGEAYIGYPDHYYYGDPYWVWYYDPYYHNSPFYNAAHGHGGHHGKKAHHSDGDHRDGGGDHHDGQGDHDQAGAGTGEDDGARQVVRKHKKKKFRDAAENIRSNRPQAESLSSLSRFSASPAGTVSNGETPASTTSSSAPKAATASKSVSSPKGGSSPSSVRPRVRTRSLSQTIRKQAQRAASRKSGKYKGLED